eukprot:3613900-Amphidinium_carterae.1
MKDAGLPDSQINLAFDYFDEEAHQHFNRPNLRNLSDVQSQLPRVREGRAARETFDGSYHPSENDEEDDIDEYDTSHQSGTTTRATKSLTKKTYAIRGSGKQRLHRQGAIVTNLYHAQITNFHAVAPPMMTRPTDDAAAGADTRATPRLQQPHMS